MLKVIYVTEIIDRVCLFMQTHYTHSLSLLFQFWRLIKLEVTTAILTVITKRIIAAEHMLALSRRSLFLTLA